MGFESRENISLHSDVERTCARSGEELSYECPAGDLVDPSSWRGAFSASGGSIPNGTTSVGAPISKTIKWQGINTLSYETGGDILFCHPGVDIRSGLECNEIELDKREGGEGEIR